MMNEKPKKTFHYEIKIPITINAKTIFEALAMAEETKKYVVEKTGLTASIERK